jgi:hypothetical protein
LNNTLTLHLVGRAPCNGTQRFCWVALRFTQPTNGIFLFWLFVNCQLLIAKESTMNFALFAKLGIFAVTSSFLLISSAHTLAENNREVLLAQSNRQLCSQQEENLLQSFYIETANFFANICRDSSGQLIYIGGEKANPENNIKLPAFAEEGTGYVAENGATTYILTGAALTVVENGVPILEENVIYSCIADGGCQER